MRKTIERVRLDQLLCARGLCPSRERARALILGGSVQVDGRPAGKPGQLVSASAQVEVRADENPYVSRGGLKLRLALDHFAVDVAGSLALDIGASTGGFTDCLLQAGALRVCALDVGYGQLAWRLRSDPRVFVLERYNARHLDAAALPFRPDLIVCDVSFISQTLLLPRMAEVMGRKNGWIITLIKPQFEVKKGEVGQGGVVRDEGLRRAAVRRCTEAAAALGLALQGVVESPIRGPAGNVEFLLALRNP